jgi:hypothetical protein
LRPAIGFIADAMPFSEVARFEERSEEGFVGVLR